MKKRILLGGCAAILLAIAACIGGSLYLIDYALRPERQETDLQTAIKEECGNYPFITPWIDSLVTHKALRDTFITADDGCALHAFYVYAARPTRKTALLIHGYGGQATGMLPIGYMYNRSLDYNILLPDLRRAGRPAILMYQRVGRVQERTEDTVPPASIPAAPHGQLVVRKKIRMELPGSLGTGTSEEMQETDDVHPRSR